MNATVKTILITFFSSLFAFVIGSFFIAYIAKDLTGKVIGEMKPRLNMKRDNFPT